MKFNLYLYFPLLFLFACTPSTMPRPSVGQKDQETSVHKDNFSLMRQAFRKTEALWNGGIMGALTFNSGFTNHYHGQIPRLPVLADDTQARYLSFASNFLLAELGSAFLEKLPTSIRASLKEHGVKRENLSIGFFVLGSGNLGEDEDFNDIPTQTHLMAHAWADPDAPKRYTGARVNRNFLLGIFEPEYDITTEEMGKNTLIESPIFVHDGYFSPRTSTSLIKIHKQSPPQTFWSVVIDVNNPEGKSRAIVTLHWVLNSFDEEWRAMQKAFMKTIKIRGYFDKAQDLWVTPQPAVNNFGQFLERINQSKEFKDTEMLKRLNALFE